MENEKKHKTIYAFFSLVYQAIRTLRQRQSVGGFIQWDSTKNEKDYSNY